MEVKEPSFNSNAHSAENTSIDSRLLNYHELPSWYQENEFILSGYRQPSGSLVTCLRSWAYLHNESVNIFSHLLPAVAALCLIFAADFLLLHTYPKANATTRALLMFYLMCVAVCFGLSAFYHTMINHSAKGHDIAIKLDYCGILLLIYADFITGEYVCFYCAPLLRDIYWSVITVSTALTAFFFIHPRFQSKQYRTLRLSMFTFLGLSAFVPLIHGLLYFGAANFASRSGFYYYLGEAGLLAVAAAVYALRWPESFVPERFDIFGASHQIFHVLTLTTVVIQLLGLHSAYDKIYHDPRC